MENRNNFLLLDPTSNLSPLQLLAVASVIKFSEYEKTKPLEKESVSIKPQRVRGKRKPKRKVESEDEEFIDQTPSKFRPLQGITKPGPLKTTHRIRVPGACEVHKKQHQKCSLNCKYKAPMSSSGDQ
jgi:hypothetical protein